MSTHPDGSGTGWGLVETADIDQPHGLDYRWAQHIAKGVRKRMNAEHAAFADATVGGIHTPGGCAVLGIEDGTATILADGTLVGHGLVWDNTARIWCSTATDGATTTGNFTLVLLHPDKQWGGADVTWTGAHEFDATTDFTGGVYVDGTAEVLNVLNCLSALHVDGTVNFDGQVEFSADTTTFLKGDVSLSGLLSCAADCISVQDGDATGEPVHFGQFSQSADVSGYVNLPGGLVVQWGKDLTFGANQARDITYTIAFPNNCFNVQISNTGDCTAFATVYYTQNAEDVSTDKFTLINNGDTTRRLSFMAIGN